MKIAVVGCSGFGQRHLKTLDRLGYEIYTYERNKKVVEEITEKFRIRKNFDTYDDLLRSDVDCVDLVLPHDMHHDFTVRALRAGKHVIVEKPISTDLETSTNMIQEAETNRRILMVAEQYHYDPTVRAIKESIDDGKIGNPVFAIIRDQRSVNQKGWRINTSSMGGGALIDGGVHYLDVAVSLFGKLSVVSSTASRGNSGIEGNDTYSAILKNEQGAVCLFFYSWSYPHPPSLPAIEVVGDAGSIYELPETRIEKQNSSGEWTPFGDIAINGSRLRVNFEDIIANEFLTFEKYVSYPEPQFFKSPNALEDLRLAIEIEKKAIKN